MSYQYDYKFYHYSDFVTVECSESVGDEENVNPKDTNDEGLTFSSQILFMSS